MNETAWQSSAPLVDGGPEWLTLSFVLIGLGVLAALFILAWGTRLAKRRTQAEHVLEDRGELHRVGTPPLMTPPASPAPTVSPAEEPLPPEPPLADEPIAAAASLDASPAALAASEPAPAPAVSTPSPIAGEGADDLTRMKGVGPKLAQRLNGLGVTRFDQLAGLSPEGAEALDAQLPDFRGRIHRDRWVEQARYLAQGDTAGYEAQFGKL
jgi:predicted flap endonuclease-1-like 5' DNA nuclease